MESMFQPTNQPTRIPVWQLVVRKPYDASGVSDFAFWLSNNTSHYLVGEHLPDEDEDRAHCHLLIEGLKVTDETLRKSLKRCDISGSDYSLMKKTKKTRLDYDRDLLAIYIVKGGIESEIKATSFYDDQLALWSSKWVNHKKPSVSNTEGVRDTVVKPKKPRSDYDKCQEILDTELSHLINTEETPDVFDIKTMRFHETMENRTKIVRGIIEWGRRTHNALHPRKVMEYYGIVLQNACPEYYADQVVDMINFQYKHSTRKHF